MPQHSSVSRTARALPLLAGVLLLLGPALARAENARLTRAVRIFREAREAVVNIHSERTINAPVPDEPWTFGPAQQRVNGMGTGIVLDPRGYILTNFHVVEDVSLLRVRLADGTTLPARVIARDPSEDLAVMKIDVKKPLPTIPFGTSADLMQGEPVIAIGNAYGYEHTLSEGIISALNRDVTLNKDLSYKALIQTNASINPGNSGGPMLNAYGELIGVNVAIRAGAQGIAFAIPVDTVVRVATELMSARRHSGVWHGLVVANRVDASSNPVRRTLVVERCEANSPASDAGLQPGDVLVSVDGVPQRCSVDLERALVEHKPGDKVEVVVRRGAGGQEVRLELALEPAEQLGGAPGEMIWKQLGMRLRPLGAESVTRINRQLHGGLTVVEVNPSAPAGRGGLRPGDILIGLHQWETVTLDNVRFVLTHPDRATFSPLRFFIIRDGKVHQGWLGAAE